MTQHRHRPEPEPDRTKLPLYDSIGLGYRMFRQPDPRIQSAIDQALGNLQPVVNVGSGAGSYEPRDRSVVAVEPSWEMIRQRQSGAAPVIQAIAEQLPFPDGSFAAALGVLTVHHWSDPRSGLAELARVARERIVLLTFDPDSEGFWLTQRYFPSIRELDRRNMPNMSWLSEKLGTMKVLPVLIPHDCTDGFLGAYWRRPRAYLEPAVRSAISAFALIPDIATGLAQLERDLDDGTWHQHFGHVLREDQMDLGYRLVIAEHA